jgi:hypothetical protein
MLKDNHSDKQTNSLLDPNSSPSLDKQGRIIATMKDYRYLLNRSPSLKTLYMKILQQLSRILLMKKLHPTCPRNLLYRSRVTAQTLILIWHSSITIQRCKLHSLYSKSLMSRVFLSMWGVKNVLRLWKLKTATSSMIKRASHLIVGSSKYVLWKLSSIN